MASNDYYQPHYHYAHSQNQSYAPSYHTNDPDPYGDMSPPLSRYNTHHDTPISPVAATPYDDRSPHSQTPFGDRSDPYAHQAPHYGYGGSGGRLGEDGDPYDDADAIPMNRRKKHESTTTIAPILPHSQSQPPEPSDDDFIRDVDPRKQSRRHLEGRPGSKDGFFGGRITWVVYTLTLIQLIVFIAEIARNAVLTNSPIEIHPSFNPMIGPSPYVLINMGSRYQPCMHNMPNVQNGTVDIAWPCPNTTSATSGSTCTLSQLCGMGGVPNPRVGGGLSDKPAPDQWWRFIIPIFIHAGIIHIGFNLLLQMTLGRDVERLIGSFRFAIVYFAAGIFGFVLGGNFAATGIASCGCSGSLFGILAITLLDLLYTWQQRASPIKDLLFILVDVAIAFALGLLPGLDNFSHIGGFLMGLVLGVCILHSPTSFSRKHAAQQSVRYSGISRPSGDPRDAGLIGFCKSPLHFFQDRKAAWWVWWLVRAAALMGCLIGFALLLKNFYEWRRTCGWCKYLSCLDVKVGGQNWCDVGELDITTTGTNSSTGSGSGNERRDLGWGGEEVRLW
ncbi:rhomboid-domain-containing protein [Teratosphaeria destructans]|uniref:Rhomboid-type serine protease n=1 Tax=Teratosphaeria destructans TaxID=418781 RepID=A0A9W7SU02_9PEZI|nr:rhomboid-domain-containing protein [Teratosphaeria destructans]